MYLLRKPNGEKVFINFNHIEKITETQNQDGSINLVVRFISGWEETWYDMPEQSLKEIYKMMYTGEFPNWMKSWYMTNT
ncbi:MAG: hypothetical protein R3321_05345 [Nitrososphaeraceae archaeon]|nr:hypothetical protein [Nitrososphaeraceae archaeon]